MKLMVYTDGWSRGNPGSAWIWVFIKNLSWKEIEKRYKYLWIKTNNEAEYLWAYYGIKRAIEIWWTQINLFMDSKLVIHQLSWEWKIKKDELIKINENILKLIKEANVKINYNWIRREDNKEADRLSNIAMDNSNMEEKI